MASNRQIYLRLVGGLGNQLYQFSYALFILKKYKYNNIIIDHSSMKNYKENWGFMLYDVLDESKLSSFVKIDSSLVHRFRLARAGSSLTSVADRLGLYGDKNLECLAPSQHKNRLYLDGYFEKFKSRYYYLDLISPYLRGDLRVSIAKNVVVLNVRGGEYARLGFSKPEDKLYYEREVNRILKDNNDVVFHLVTDDKTYALNLIGNDIDISKIYEPDPFLNFRIIYSANTKILSNSTFAKWAGFLSSDFSKSTYQSKF